MVNAPGLAGDMGFAEVSSVGSFGREVLDSDTAPLFLDYSGCAAPMPKSSFP
jgi:hypothetical protein